MSIQISKRTQTSCFQANKKRDPSNAPKGWSSDYTITRRTARWIRLVPLAPTWNQRWNSLKLWHVKILISLIVALNHLLSLQRNFRNNSCHTYAKLAANCSSSFPYLANWTAKPHLFGILFTAIFSPFCAKKSEVRGEMSILLWTIWTIWTFKMLAKFVNLVKIKRCVQHFQHSCLLGHEINSSVVANRFLPKNGDKVIQMLTKGVPFICTKYLHLFLPPLKFV